MTEKWKTWLNAIISALVAFLTALGVTSCAEFINL